MKEVREHWPLMTFYERFEMVVAVILSLIVTLVTTLTLVQLMAMEFKHSIIRVAQRRGSIVQVKTVVLIALIALARKFVILDNTLTDASTIAAMAGATLVLGVVYWLLRERDDRLAGHHDMAGDD